MRRAVQTVLIVGCVTWAVVARAKSLSDLNLDEFQEQKTETTAPAMNPFLPPRVAKEELLVQDLRLTGVAYTEGEAYALVSGMIIRVGDRISEYRVSTIERSRVILRKLDETVVLRLEGAL